MLVEQEVSGYQLSMISVNKIYDNGVQALTDVNLDVSPGIFGLLGPNGAGKSSLMRTIVGLQEPSSGQILFGGKDISKNKVAYRKEIGYLPQDFGVYPDISAIKLLDHFAVLKGFVNKKERKEVVEGLLAQTNLWEKRDHHLGTFSGGMIRRFGLAQALIGSPKLLVIDEPTSGLDPGERYRLLNLLTSISKETIILLSTHIVQDVSDLCPRFAILKSGKLIMDGQPEAAVKSIDGKIWRKAVDFQGKDLESTYENVISKRFVAGIPNVHVYADNPPDSEFEPTTASLEDFYFSKMNSYV